MWTRNPSEAWADPQTNDELGTVSYRLIQDFNINSIKIIAKIDKTYQINFSNVKNIQSLRNAIAQIEYTPDELLDHTIAPTLGIHLQREHINSLFRSLLMDKQIPDTLLSNVEETMQIAFKALPFHSKYQFGFSLYQPANTEPSTNNVVLPINKETWQKLNKF